MCRKDTPARMRVRPDGDRRPRKPKPKNPALWVCLKRRGLFHLFTHREGTSLVFACGLKRLPSMVFSQHELYAGVPHYACPDCDKLRFLPTPQRA